MSARFLSLFASLGADGPSDDGLSVPTIARGRLLRGIAPSSWLRVESVAHRLAWNRSRPLRCLESLSWPSCGLFPRERLRSLFRLAWLDRNEKSRDVPRLFSLVWLLALGDYETTFGGFGSEYSGEVEPTNFVVVGS